MNQILFVVWSLKKAERDYINTHIKGGGDQFHHGLLSKGMNYALTLLSRGGLKDPDHL